jgi:hypothetical protein
MTPPSPRVLRGHEVKMTDFTDAEKLGRMVYRRRVAERKMTQGEASCRGLSGGNAECSLSQQCL